MKDLLIPTRTWCREGAAGADAVEQHENRFGILFCYILLYLKAQKLLSYTIVLEAVTWEADSGMEIREQDGTGSATGVNTCGREGPEEERNRSGLRGKLDCNTCQQRWALQLSQVGLVFLFCIRSVIRYGLPLEGAVTLGETVIFNQNNPQRGLTAETYQLTTSPVFRGISFPFPKGDLVAHHGVPVH